MGNERHGASRICIYLIELDEHNAHTRHKSFVRSWPGTDICSFLMNEAD